MAQIIQERWEKVQKLPLWKGAHSPNSTFCVMEAVAFVAGEKWTDAPECACPIISTFLRSWNDALPTNEDRNRLLKPLIPRLVGTRNKALEQKRGMMVADWLVRVHTPAWLRLAGLSAQADELSNLPEITSFAQFPTLCGTIEVIREDARAARDAARDAAWDAARAAAWAAARAAAWDAAWAAARAAAWDAARAAAWAAAGDAAGDAAWDAARAAAGAAARAAAGAAAREKLGPTCRELQQSALQLVERMIEAT